MLKITLTAARINAGFTVEEVAKQLNKGENTIINWERGITSPRISDFNKLCNLYRISKDYIDLSITLQKVEEITQENMQEEENKIGC